MEFLESSSIPKDILFKIVSKLDIRDIVSLLDIPEFWKFLLNEHFPDVLKIPKASDKENYFRILGNRLKNSSNEMLSKDPIASHHLKDLRYLEKEIAALRKHLSGHEEIMRQYNSIKDQRKFISLHTKSNFKPRTYQLPINYSRISDEHKHGNIYLLKWVLGDIVRDKYLKPGTLIIDKNCYIYIYREKTIPCYIITEKFPQRLIKDMMELGVTDIAEIKKSYGIDI